MTKHRAPVEKILVLSSQQAELVLAAITQARPSSFTPAQREQLPDLCRALGRFQVATAAELREELIDLLQQQKRDRGQPPKQQTPINIEQIVADAHSLLKAESANSKP